MAKCKQGYIYPAKKGKEYSKKYDHYLCCMDIDDAYIVDCIPCTKNGDYAPGIECGVPTYTSVFYSTRGVKLEY